MSKKRDTALCNLSHRLGGLGISPSDQYKLRRIEMTLHRWGENEADGNIQREGLNGDGKPRWYSPLDMFDPDKPKGTLIPDRERGALRRLGHIMDKYSELWFYHQTDPRGCALYVGQRPDILKDFDPGMIYTKGVAVCID